MSTLPGNAKAAPDGRPLRPFVTPESFVGKLGEESGASVLVSGIVDLAHALGLKVIAEGVETGEQLERLRETGCDAAQGYYFSEPLSHEETETLLAARARRVGSGDKPPFRRG